MNLLLYLFIFYLDHPYSSLQLDGKSNDDLCLIYETTRIRICNHASCSAWTIRYDVFKGKLICHSFMFLYKVKVHRNK